MNDSEKIDALFRMVSRIEKKIDQLDGKEEKWVSKERAMQLIGCDRTKLQTLVTSGRVQVNTNPKKGRQLKYELKSIMDYLDNPN